MAKPPPAFGARGRWEGAASEGQACSVVMLLPLREWPLHGNSFVLLNALEGTRLSGRGMSSRRSGHDWALDLLCWQATTQLAEVHLLRPPGLSDERSGWLLVCQKARHVESRIAAGSDSGAACGLQIHRRRQPRAVRSSVRGRPDCRRPTSERHGHGDRPDHAGKRRCLGGAWKR